MKKSDRLKPVVTFKQRLEDDAAKRLADAAREMSTQKQRLHDLESYCEEYGQQFSQNGSQGMSASQVRGYHHFMQNLIKALDQQKAAIERLEKEYENKKRQWLAARNNTKALNSVRDRYISQELTLAEKHEQKEQDDRSSRKQTR